MKAVQIQDKRVGSTFLQNSIDSHPNILALDEVFISTYNSPDRKKSGIRPFKIMSEEKGWKIGEYIKWIYNMNDNVIFKLMYNQCDIYDMIDYMVSDKNFNIIHLMRKNFAKRAVSQIKEQGVKIALEFKNSEIINIIEKSIDEQELFRKRLSLTYGKYLELWYEDIIGIRKDNITFVDKDVNKHICDFFEVENIPLFSIISKRSNKVWKTISSRKSLIKEFEKRGWDDYLK